MVTKDQDTLIEQSLCAKYSNRAVKHVCKLEILQLILLKLSKIKTFQANTENR